ncbi:lasso peptide biosynthesis PqqD family chaperone [Nocardia testacea]|uniref:lasso peptide biosynthesis PqqD family chaperone n=1 Tax=Nocardia testacea TaxID=248551 RepID=UPI0033E4B4E9
MSICPTEDGTILLDQRHGRYWQLNTTGAEILTALLDGATPDEIVRRLVDTRPVDRQRAADDVTDLLARLVRAGLVTS